MANLIASSPTKEGLIELINRFYLSDNWFINDNGRAENKETGKVLGKVVRKKGRYRYEL